jgi:hypothetical protein
MRLRAPLALTLLALVARAGSGEPAPSAFATPSAKAEELALRKALERYERAIESKDLEGFRAVKPNLTADEEQRMRKAFQSVQSQDIEMTVLAAEVRDGEAVLKVSRRDTINQSIVSSFPQTFTLTRAREGWIIQGIAGR